MFLTLGVTSTLCGSGPLHFLLLGLHDAGEQGESRMIEAEIGCDDGRQGDRNGLRAPVDPRKTSALPFSMTTPGFLAFSASDSRAHPSLRANRSLRPAEISSQELGWLRLVRRPWFVCPAMTKSGFFGQ